MKKEKNLSIKSTKKDGLSKIPILSIKKRILGESYELSIACVSKKISQELNNKFRKKNYPTNILSFPLSKNSGEIILHIPSVKKDAPAFNMSYTNFMGFLVIHGMLHLKGMEHGSTMERQEKKFYKEFFNDF